MSFKIEHGGPPLNVRTRALVATALFAALLTVFALYASTSRGVRSVNLGRLHVGTVADSGSGPAAAATATAATPTAAAAGSTAPASSWENSYQFNLSRPDLQQGLVSMGGMGARARRVLNKLLLGQPLRVAFLGGSITFGHHTSWKDNTHYVGFASDWIKTAFPHPDHKLSNGGIPGVGSR